ncbi:hypothetical protein PsYK624_087830 [Phanerochaete sordida]|uniref:Beta-ketoacyl synthase C-terminal domain-containing protein n=1 Tax=Phanerochaete sordida TaxID=48140 RepID=A0A9P3GAT7_9APHY|nr:hypothetical protein PsYK624_087830 [Phanerochaete sordida]
MRADTDDPVELVALRAVLAPRPPAAPLFVTSAKENLGHAGASSVTASLAQLWRVWSVQPDAVARHSLKESTALNVADVPTLEDALRLVPGRA